MEVGYSTLDLVMLLIAAFVVCVVLRTPKIAATAEKQPVKIKKVKNNSAQPAASL